MPHRIARSAASTYRKALLQLIGKIGMQLHAVHGRRQGKGRGRGKEGHRGPLASGGVLACGQNPAVSALARSIGKLSKGLAMHANRFISRENNWAWESQGMMATLLCRRGGGVGEGVAWLTAWLIASLRHQVNAMFFRGDLPGGKFQLHLVRL